jgi:hypothetical protein
VILTTTLNRIRLHSPCEDGWKKLLKSLGKTQADDEVLEFKTILDSNGLDDAIWCLRVEPHHANLYRLFAVRQARKVQHLMKDQRSLDALDVAERHANGQASNGELAAARDSAWGAHFSTSWFAAQTAYEIVALACYKTAAEAAYQTAYRTAAQESSKRDFIEMFCTE